MKSLGERADEWQIEQTLYRYASALDTKNWDLLATTFTDDIVFTPDGFEPLVGFETIRDAVRSALQGQRSQHYLSNVTITLDGDEATARSYLQAQHIRPEAEGGPTLIVAGIYTDVLRRAGEGWQFVRRGLSVLWTRGNPAVPLGKVAGGE